MKCILAIALVFCLIPSVQAQPLEEVMIGEYRARGVFAPAPDKPQERLTCRLQGFETGVGRFVLEGRCASANTAGDMQIDVEVIVPGRDYLAWVQFQGEDLLGFEDAYEFNGLAGEGEVMFEADAQIDGFAYRSHFSIIWDATGINKIVEVARGVDSGTQSVLIDLDVRRR